MATGKIKWFNATKGYGFIVPDEGGGDVFIHVTALEKAGLGPVGEGQRLSYEIASNKGRESAVNIQLLEDSA